jgi:hypothetical protein
MDEHACPGCRELLHRVAELEAQVAELTRELNRDELEVPRREIGDNCGVAQAKTAKDQD